MILPGPGGFAVAEAQRNRVSTRERVSAALALTYVRPFFITHAILGTTMSSRNNSDQPFAHYTALSQNAYVSLASLSYLPQGGFECLQSFSIAARAQC